MNQDDLKNLLQQIYDRSISAEEGLEKLKFLPFQDIGFAKVDSHRYIRKGFPEVIYGAGKTVEEVTGITRTLAAKFPNILITRGSVEMHEAVYREIPEAVFHSRSRAITIHREKHDLGMGLILVVSAGTSDIPVADFYRKKVLYLPHRKC